MIIMNCAQLYADKSRHLTGGRGLFFNIPLSYKCSNNKLRCTAIIARPPYASSLRHFMVSNVVAVFFSPSENTVSLPRCTPENSNALRQQSLDGELVYITIIHDVQRAQRSRKRKFHHQPMLVHTSKVTFSRVTSLYGSIGTFACR